MHSNTAIWNFSILEIGPRQNWFISRFLWRCSLWCSTDWRGQISFITFWIFVFISPYLSIKNWIFRTLLILHNYIYQMRKRNIMKYCLLIPKHLVIQLAKLHIDILNLNTTFLQHCKKIRLLLNKGVDLPVIWNVMMFTWYRCNYDNGTGSLIKPPLHIYILCVSMLLIAFPYINGCAMNELFRKLSCTHWLLLYKNAVGTYHSIKCFDIVANIAYMLTPTVCEICYFQYIHYA